MGTYTRCPVFFDFNDSLTESSSSIILDDTSKDLKLFIVAELTFIVGNYGSIPMPLGMHLYFQLIR
jgi:hypothetical protein